VLAPAGQLVRRPVVQIVGSRHSSLSSPSTTVTASAPPPCRWTPELSPAGQRTNQASTSEVRRSGTGRSRRVGAVDNPGTPSAGSVTLPVGGPAYGRGGSVMSPGGPVMGGGGSVMGWAARRVARSTRAASDHSGGYVSLPVGRMRLSLG
jgi:hypothetical protein